MKYYCKLFYKHNHSQAGVSTERKAPNIAKIDTIPIKSTSIFWLRVRSPFNL